MLAFDFLCQWQALSPQPNLRLIDWHGESHAAAGQTFDFIALAGRALGTSEITEAPCDNSTAKLHEDA